jgi:hypothetical protein
MREPVQLLKIAAPEFLAGSAFWKGERSLRVGLTTPSARWQAFGRTGTRHLCSPWGHKSLRNEPRQFSPAGVGEVERPAREGVEDQLRGEPKVAEARTTALRKKAG